MGESKFKRARILDHVGLLLAGEMVGYCLYYSRYSLIDKPGLLQIDMIVVRWWQHLLAVFSFLQVREYSLLVGYLLY